MTRARTLLATAALAATVGGCNSSARRAFEVLVHPPAGSVPPCMTAAAWTPPGAPVYSENFSDGGPGPYSIAVYEGATLGADVLVEAYGYSDPGCTSLTSRSDQEPATFGVTSSVSLALFPVSQSDAGPDGGGPRDAGALPDAGPSPDAGPAPDAGPLPCQPGRGCGPSDAGVCDLAGGCDVRFPYVPSNFDPTNATRINGTVVIDCAATFDTTAFPDSGTLQLCGRPVQGARVTQTNAGGPEVVLVQAASLIVTDAGSATLQGPYPVIWAVYGPAEVDGVMRASAGSSPGPGADTSVNCNPRLGLTGGGGGGGGFGQPGGNGGFGGSIGIGGQGGSNVGGSVQQLTPLIGGCSGAAGGGGSAGNGGGAGGAIQISAAQTIVVSGVVAASGASGEGGSAGGGGGGGGGSGGGVLLEASRLTLKNVGGGFGVLSANGGGGGAGGAGSAGAPGSPGNDGNSVPSAGGTGANQAGSGGSGGAGSGGANQRGQDAADGSNGEGGGGGGGGVGYIRINATANGCNLSSGTTRSGQYSSTGPGC